MPPRGPRSVLCVVVDTTSATGTGDETGNVRDIGGEHGADLARDLAECGEVDRARDRGAAGKHQLGALLARELADLVEIDAVRVLAHAVLHALEVTARDRHVPAVREVAAGWEPHAHHGVARLE